MRIEAERVNSGGVSCALDFWGDGSMGAEWRLLNYSTDKACPIDALDDVHLAQPDLASRAVRGQSTADSSSWPAAIDFALGEDANVLAVCSIRLRRRDEDRRVREAERIVERM